ncbi:chemotaxis protein methyltransferase CheR [Streptomyces sp. NBRC 110611]|nr:chemotaxis protein methyltransferase CheR [Streptomyces sp. NBRC 110611]
MAVQAAWQTASDVRKRLDNALRRVGFNAEPSLVSVTRNGPDRIAPPNLPVADAERLAVLLESMPEAVTRR